jgi:hypothetical protein
LTLVATEVLTTGDLIRGGFAELRGNLRPVLIYLAVRRCSSG